MNNNKNISSANWSRDKSTGRIRRVDLEESHDGVNQTDIQYSLDLDQLPLVVLLQMFDNLTVRDIARLKSVNVFLHQLINRVYVTSVTLPVSREHAESIRHKQVLRMISTSNLAQLDMANFLNYRNLNLSKLRELRLTGTNHIWNKQYLLSHQYKFCLENLLKTINPKTIQEMELLTDESSTCVRIMAGLVRFINLHKLVINGIGYFSPCSSYHMDKDAAQNIVNNILSNTNLKVLHLKYFQTINRCVIIRSESLEHLDAELGKNFEIGYLNLPNVRTITIDTSMWYGCFYHAQNSELKNIVYNGCPKLESFNSINLVSLSEKSSSGDWLDQLRDFSHQEQQETGGGQCLLCRQNMQM